jgi:DNA-binding CsgD family transcriptional regulator
MRQCDAERLGIDRKTFQRIKTRIRKFGEINIKTQAVSRLLAMN